ncbi:hypothetical protein [Mumia zhuanghuii]|uniref:Protein ImuA n=1 Tax=Mumia zhuanghuii TaxID=2585211 RepID=A0A5C4MDT8_9ACTN|nr:hypothetical protein [Mumia zhuanghuii]TNC35436.1 hypothetical protein FHE65_27185 [Mumia zhuanghuii]
MTGAAVLDQLAARVRAMEGAAPVRDRLPTLPALSQVVPGGVLRGATYEVSASLSLSTALVAGPSAAGAWCAVVGVPELGAEAAAALGVALERTILVPAPGEHWPHVVSALADVTDAILLRPPTPVRDGEAQRVAARLRQHRTTLVVLAARPGAWPRAQGRLEVTESRWTGVGEGFGHLQRRRVTVSATSRGGRPHRTRLWLDTVAEPDASVVVAEAAEADASVVAWRRPGRFEVAS